MAYYLIEWANVEGGFAKASKAVSHMEVVPKDAIHRELVRAIAYKEVVNRRRNTRCGTHDTKSVGDDIHRSHLQCSHGRQWIGLLIVRHWFEGQHCPPKLGQCLL